MKKDEFIGRYGEAAWKDRLAQSRAYHKAHMAEEKVHRLKWREAHREEERARSRDWREVNREKAIMHTQKWQKAHPEQVKAYGHERCRKGGKYYEKKLVEDQTGLRGERNRIRMKHANQYRPLKKIIAPESQIHHEWIPETAEYRGLALVEAKPHRYGIIDVIQILDGKITLLTEEEVKRKKKK